MDERGFFSPWPCIDSKWVEKAKDGGGIEATKIENEEGNGQVCWLLINN